MATSDTIELKFKEKGQIAKWEDLPIVQVSLINNLGSAVVHLVRLFQMVEIRWNFRGSLQGHYIGGNVSRFKDD